MHALESSGGLINARREDTSLVGFRSSQGRQTWARTWLRKQQQTGHLNLGANDVRLETITIREIFQEYGALRALSAPGGVIFLDGRGAANAPTIGHEILHQFDRCSMM